jgi:hypothetical protein
MVCLVAADFPGKYNTLVDYQDALPYCPHSYKDRQAQFL